jgi:segregation and condensation protein B
MTDETVLEKEDKLEKEDMNAADQLDFSDVEEGRECPFSMIERKRVLEALLFVSDKPIGLSQMVSAFGYSEDDQPLVTNKEVEEALKEYQAEVEEQNRGYRLHSVSGGYQLRTSEEMKPFLQNTIKARTFRLTGPTLETLAIVAYKQPITKSQVDDIRGVDSSHLIRGLMDKDLLAFAGKSELPGKPMLYKTTTRFLEIFGLRNLNELPSLSEIEALIPEGIGNEEEEEAQTLSQLTGKLSEEAEDSYSVSEEEHDKIVGELSQISTSTEFFEEEKRRERERNELEKAENIREALMVGEEVSDRDKRWLERYEEKMNTDADNDDSSAHIEAMTEGDESVENGVELEALADQMQESEESSEPNDSSTENKEPESESETQFNL